MPINASPYTLSPKRHNHRANILSIIIKPVLAVPLYSARPTLPNDIFRIYNNHLHKHRATISQHQNRRIFNRKSAYSLYLQIQFYYQINQFHLSLSMMARLFEPCHHTDKFRFHQLYQQKFRHN